MYNKTPTSPVVEIKKPLIICPRKGVDMSEYYNPSEFRNKVAIITGAAGGIGRAMCLKFAILGTNLILVDSDEINLKLISDELSKRDVNLLPILCDLYPKKWTPS